MRVAILTVSDSRSGDRPAAADTSGDAIQAWCELGGFAVEARSAVPDDATSIVARLLEWSDSLGVDLILTTGGTGLSPRDVTPEATLAVLEREAPGIAELLRVQQFGTFPRAALSRGVAGVRAQTLIVNLPGSPSGVRDSLALLGDIIEHACDVVAGRPTGHEPAGPERRDEAARP